MLSTIEEFFEKRGTPLDGYWPDERPVSVLILNLQILTQEGFLPWVKYPVPKEHYSSIRVGSNALEVNSIAGEVVTELFGYTITIYKTMNEEEKLYFFLAVESDGVVRRIVESDEHRHFSLCSIYDQSGEEFLDKKRASSFEKINEARRRALETLRTMFL